MKFKAISAGHSDGVSTVLLTLTLLYFFIGLPPYGTIGASSSSNIYQGSLANQIVWPTFACIACGLIVKNFSNTRLLLSLSRPMILLLLWCIASVTWAIEFEVAAIRVVRLLLVVFVSTAVIASLHSPRRVYDILLFVTGISLVLNLAVSIFLPAIGQDALGNFTGLHSHKNTAGIMGMVTMLLWLSGARHAGRGRKQIGFIAGTCLAVLFVVATGSKTALTVSLGVPLIVVPFLYLRRNFNGKLMVPTGFLITAIALCVLMTMSFNATQLGDLPGIVLSDTSLTGRTGLWQWMIQEIVKRPWAGHGVGSFWNTSAANALQRIGPEWLQSITQAHNGYLDVLATIGIVGVALLGVLLFSIIGLGWHSLCGGLVSGARSLIEGLWSIAIATVLYNFSESSFLSAGSVLWFILVITNFTFVRWGAQSSPDHLKISTSTGQYENTPGP